MNLRSWKKREYAATVAALKGRMHNAAKPFHDALLVLVSRQVELELNLRTYAAFDPDFLEPEGLLSEAVRRMRAADEAELAEFHSAIEVQKSILLGRRLSISPIVRRGHEAFFALRLTQFLIAIARLVHFAFIAAKTGLPKLCVFVLPLEFRPTVQPNAPALV